MSPNLLTGNRVRLAADEPEVAAKSFARWARDTEYHRLLNFDPAYLWSEKKWKNWLEKDLEKESPGGFFFSIRELLSEHMIGFLGLWDIEWTHGNAWVAIGLGDREYWGKGYGTEAMNLALNFAFTELNLYRVSLGVFEYNTRAQKSYEKSGFSVEGRLRKVVQRAGRRWDVVSMGICQPDWQCARTAEA